MKDYGKMHSEGPPGRPNRKGVDAGLETGVSDTEKFKAGSEYAAGQTETAQTPTRGKKKIPGRGDPDHGAFVFKC